MGDTALLVFPLCVLLVFLVLAAQYESLFLPLAIILIVPMCLFSAITGVWLTGGNNNIFTQIGLFVLIGLACKNAILIVEFARELEIQGRSTLDVPAIQAARLRLRPHPDDQLGLHHGRIGAAGGFVRCGRGDASCHGYHCVLRHVGRDLLWSVSDAGLLHTALRALEKRVTGTEKVHQHVRGAPPSRLATEQAGAAPTNHDPVLIL